MSQPMLQIFQQLILLLPIEHNIISQSRLNVQHQSKQCKKKSQNNSCLLTGQFRDAATNHNTCLILGFSYGIFVLTSSQTRFNL